MGKWETGELLTSLCAVCARAVFAVFRKAMEGSRSPTTLVACGFVAWVAWEVGLGVRGWRLQLSALRLSNFDEFAVYRFARLFEIYPSALGSLA